MPCAAAPSSQRVLSVGPSSTVLPELTSLGEASATLQFLAVQPGLHQLPDLVLLEPGAPEAIDVLKMSVRVT